MHTGRRWIFLDNFQGLPNTRKSLYAYGLSVTHDEGVLHLIRVAIHTPSHSPFPCLSLRYRSPCYAPHCFPSLWFCLSSRAMIFFFSLAHTSTLGRRTWISRSSEALTFYLFQWCGWNYLSASESHSRWEASKSFSCLAFEWTEGRSRSWYTRQERSKQGRRVPPVMTPRSNYHIRRSLPILHLLTTT